MQLFPSQERKMFPLSPVATKKDRVSVCQTTQANSKEESKALSDEFSHNYALKSSPIVWMNKRLTVEWVQSGLEHFHSNADYYHGILLIVI